MLRTLSLLALLALAAPTFAQSHADAMARLAPFAGTYALDGSAEIEEGTFDGSLAITPILGGRFQQWDWEMDMHAQAGTERALLRFIVGFDAATGTYTIYRFDSRDADSPTVASNIGDPTQGRLSVEGDALVMAWTTANPDDLSMTGTFRNRVRLTSSGLDVHTEVAPDDGSPTVAIATTRAARR